MNIYLKKPDEADNIIRYNGHELPKDKVKYVAPVKDYSNYPSLTIIGLTLAEGVKLPSDCAIYINGKKTIAQSKILDGVAVFERILRDPYEIEFEFVLRTKADTGGEYIFPQKAIETVWKNIFLPDSVLKIQNTYLNGLGVTEIVVESITPTTVRGSKNMPVRIKCFENIEGSSIIIS